MRLTLLSILFLLLISCNKKQEKTKPIIANITESVYASGTIKSQNQYQAFATVNGIIDNVFVKNGDTVHVGTPLFSIINDLQQLSKDNATLTEKFNDIKNNQDKLNDALLNIDLAKTKLKNDSSLLQRQKSLWQQDIGTKNELDQRSLAYESSKIAYSIAINKYQDIKKQLDFLSSQTKKNLQISEKQVGDYIVRSTVEGTVYNTLKEKGEAVSMQTPLAIIGSNKNFILEMQVDEYDIFKIKLGQKVLVTMDSYKGKVFEATVTKINPIMNERTKTVLVEATFITTPETLYPFISFEANIVLQTKEKALLIPRNYVVNDSFVLNINNQKVAIKTGLKDYQMVEVLSGITVNDEMIKPAQ